MDPWAEYLARRTFNRPDAVGSARAGPSESSAGHQREASQRFPPGVATTFPTFGAPNGVDTSMAGEHLLGNPTPMPFGPVGAGIRPEVHFGNPLLATGAPPSRTMSSPWPTMFSSPWGLPYGNPPVGLRGGQESRADLPGASGASSSPTAFATPSNPAAPTTSRLDSSNNEPRMNASTAAQTLDGLRNHSSPSPTSVTSAFDVLGVPAPKGARAPPDQGERFIQAITGERKSIPSWNGQPGTLRSWLKLLAYWESETTLAPDKWGLRLYQSFPEGSQPRKIADQICMGELLKESGYAVLGCGGPGSSG